MALKKKTQGRGNPGTPKTSPTEPKVTVGIMDGRESIAGSMNGRFRTNGPDAVSGGFTALAGEGVIILSDEQGREIGRSSRLKLSAGDGAAFVLHNVTIGNRFHWERREDQTFRGDLILALSGDRGIAAINEIGLENYLESVISSEMSAAAPPEFLKVHAILSRSWLLSALNRKKTAKSSSPGEAHAMDGEGNITRWYEQEEHDLFDVCADDHCQRYQGITKIISPEAGEAVRRTAGRVVAYKGHVCDARYSKACGGLTENFETAWADTHVPYLESISDAPVRHGPVAGEDDARRWILSGPEAYCNTQDAALLEKILPDFDRETKGFFRWEVEYGREDLENILREKSGLDFGTLKEISPLARGPSGRIWKLGIRGSKRSIVVGKELEIRRWLSRSHLLSSAFIVSTEHGPDGEVSRLTFHGAGWGHGVGLCQIGAAVMADRGFKAEEILTHYFPGVAIKKLY
jgi:stage II sporulation protein D